MEEYVTKEIAKLLYELGFDGFCLTYYEEHIETPKYSTSGKIYRSKLEEKEEEHNKNSEWKVKYYLAPTQQMVKSWLRTVHQIFIREDYKIYNPSSYYCSFHHQKECYVEAKNMTDGRVISYQCGQLDKIEDVVNEVILEVLQKIKEKEI